MRDKTDPARLLSRGINVLSVIGRATTSISFRQIQDETSLPKATLSRILATLRKQGYLSLDNSGKAYLLGPKLLDLLSGTENSRSNRSALKSEVQRLADELERPIWYWHLEGEQMRAVEQFLPFGMAAVAATREPSRLDRSAAGVAALASMKNARLATILEGFRETRQSKDTNVSLMLGFSAATGFAIKIPFDLTYPPDTADDNLYEVAAAMTDAEGLPWAALSVICETTDTSDTERHQIGRKVAFTARQISAGPNVGPRRKDVGHRNVHAMPADVAPFIVEKIDTKEFDKVGSSPFWDPAFNRIVWIDSLGGAINWYSPPLPTDSTPAGSTSHRLAIDDLPGAIALHAGGKATVALRSGISVLDYTANTRSVISHPEPSDVLRRFSAAKVSPDGRLWVSTLHPVPIDELKQGRIYALGGDGKIEKMLDLGRGAKGFCWSADGQYLFLTEAGSKAILRFEMDEHSGRPVNPRRFAIHTGDGTPNGIVMDNTGCLWAAIYGGWQIACFDSQGQLINTIDLPVPLPTGLCFYGRKEQDLFVTTCRLHVPPETLLDAPASGAPFRIRTNATGTSLPGFKML